jgi:hypothetical protein
LVRLEGLALLERERESVDGHIERRRPSTYKSMWLRMILTKHEAPFDEYGDAMTIEGF